MFADFDCEVNTIGYRSALCVPRCEREERLLRRVLLPVRVLLRQADRTRRAALARALLWIKDLTEDELYGDRATLNPAGHHRVLSLLSIVLS